MPRIRQVKPEFFADQDLAEDLPGRDGRDARLLYIGLWGLADEHGRLRGDSRWIKGQLYSYEDDLTDEDVGWLIDMIVASGRAMRYTVGRSAYLFLPKLAGHQRLEPEKVASKLPIPPDPEPPQTDPDSAQIFSDESAPRVDEPASSPEDRRFSSSSLSASVLSSPSLMPGADEPAPDPAEALDPDALLPKPPAETKEKTKRATRCPEDFQPSAALLAWAAEKVPRVDLVTETIKFVNHFVSKGGAAGTKLNWDRTWQNWMLTAADRFPARASPNGSGHRPYQNPADVSEYDKELIP